MQFKSTSVEGDSGHSIVGLDHQVCLSTRGDNNLCVQVPELQHGTSLRHRWLVHKDVFGSEREHH